MRIEDVLQALRNADAAGDKASATRLAEIANRIINPESAIPVDYTMGEILSKGVRRGAKQLGSTFGDIIPAMGASALGFEDYAKRQMEEARQTQQEIAQTVAPQYKSLSDVKGIGDVVPFALETVAEQVPNIATSLVPGVGAGALAARAGAGALGKAAAVNAGTFLGAYAQNAPKSSKTCTSRLASWRPGLRLYSVLVLLHLTLSSPLRWLAACPARSRWASWRKCWRSPAWTRVCCDR
jgi:hypothetical protein